MDENLYDDLYSEHILEHARSPHNNKILHEAISTTVHNQMCGDDLILYMDILEGRVVDCSFVSSGCALSCAGGSLCTDYFKNKTLPELKLITPGNIYELFNISINPNRANCVLLAYKALQLFLKDNMIH